MNLIDRDPDETKDIRLLIAEVIDCPDEWLDRPNSQLSGWKPGDLIGTGYENQLRDLVRAIKIGMFS